MRYEDVMRLAQDRQKTAPDDDDDDDDDDNGSCYVVQLNITKVLYYIILRCRSQLSTFMKAYREYSF